MHVETVMFVHDLPPLGLTINLVFQESDTASAMTTLTTSTAIGPPSTNHPHPRTSESACVNVGGNATMMIIDAPPPPDVPATSLSSITTNPVPALLPEMERDKHLHMD